MDELYKQQPPADFTAGQRKTGIQSWQRDGKLLLEVSEWVKEVTLTGQAELNTSNAPFEPESGRKMKEPELLS